jgi:hypothetical protein
MKVKNSCLQKNYPLPCPPVVLSTFFQLFAPLAANVSRAASCASGDVGTLILFTGSATTTTAGAGANSAGDASTALSSLDGFNASTSEAGAAGSVATSGLPNTIDFNLSPQVTFPVVAALTASTLSTITISLNIYFKELKLQ